MEKAAPMRLKEVFDMLAASPDGLTTEETQPSLKKYGFNTLVEKKAASLALIAVVAEKFRKLFTRKLSKISKN